MGLGKWTLVIPLVPRVLEAPLSSPLVWCTTPRVVMVPAVPVRS